MVVLRQGSGAGREFECDHGLMGEDGACVPWRGVQPTTPLPSMRECCCSCENECLIWQIYATQGQAERRQRSCLVSDCTVIDSFTSPHTTYMHCIGYICCYSYYLSGWSPARLLYRHRLVHMFSCAESLHRCRIRRGQCRSSQRIYRYPHR